MSTLMLSAAGAPKQTGMMRGFVRRAERAGKARAAVCARCGRSGETTNSGAAFRSALFLCDRCEDAAAQTPWRAVPSMWDV